jgi:hypothetical protein
VKIFVPTVIYCFLLIIFFVTSGAALRVHIVDALSLFVAFWIPAGFVRSLSDIRVKLKIILPIILLGILVWDLLSSVVITKREFFREAHVVYPLGILTMMTLLVIHALTLEAFTRRPQGKEKGHGSI